jgi:hypothetical protein
MSIKESSATALVRARGIGIFCFNPNKKQGEMALIRDKRHTLTVKVQKPIFNDGSDRDTVNYSAVIEYRQIDPLNVCIEIEGIGNPIVGGYEIYKSGVFDRLNPAESDENDFRWLVNLEGEEMHERLLTKQESQVNGSRSPVSKLFIKNGIFYARTINKNLFFEKLRKDATGAVIERTDFGYVAETVATKIEADFVSFKIRIGTEEHSHILPRISGSPYKIEIDNMDLDQENPISDMPDFYNFLVSADGQSFDLEPKKDESDSGDSTSKSGSCHAIVSEQDSIENFI